MVRGLISLVVMLALLVPARADAPSAGIGAEPVASGLDWPAGFTVAPDGRLFYGERFTGEIRTFDPDTGSDTLFFTVTNLSTQGEQGLLGLALAPGYPTRPFLFVYATRLVEGIPFNQILRIRDAGGAGTSPRVIYQTEVPAGTFHNGGRILFGPDERLFAVVGNHGDGNHSQDLTNTAGKVLRMTARGTVPPDNPGRSLIYAYGIRNSYGFAFDPLTERLWETEAGPHCNDEINLIERGGNFGWGPVWTCNSPPPPPANTNQSGPDPIFPLAWFTPPITPVGTAFCVGCNLDDSEGTLFFGTYNTREIRRAVLTGDRMDIESMATVYTNPGFILSLERGPDGTLYFSDFDTIYRLVSN